MRTTHNKFDAEALSTINHEKMLLAEKLKAIKSACQSTEARLKTAEAQAEDQHKQLYTPKSTSPLGRQRFLTLKLNCREPRRH